MIKLIFSISILFIFSSCSWNEYFVISNSSKVETTATYKLLAASNGFPIFSQQPRLYKLNSTHEIDWGTETKVVDLDTSLSGYQIKIPASHALIFGELSNDHYLNHDQRFINGRFFNLLELSVSNPNFNIVIAPINFDDNFKKVNGNIQLVIK